MIMPGVYNESDSAALELHWDPLASWDLFTTVADGLATGARRIAICVEAANYSKLPSGILEIPRVAVVVSHSSSISTVHSQCQPSRQLRRVTPQSLVRQIRQLSARERQEYLIGSIFRFSPGIYDLSAITLDNDVTVRVWDNVVSSALLLSHPCFAYGCAARDCHLGRSLPPRRIMIAKDGSVIPYNLDIQNFTLGNVSTRPLTQILKYYIETEVGLKFRSFAHEQMITAVANGLSLFSVDALLTLASGES